MKAKQKMRGNGRTSPPGAATITRCLMGEEKCSKSKPDLVEIEAGHFVSCFLTSPGGQGLTGTYHTPEEG